MLFCLITIKLIQFSEMVYEVIRVDDLKEYSREFWQAFKLEVRDINIVEIVVTEYKTSLKSLEKLYGQLYGVYGEVQHTVASHSQLLTSRTRIKKRVTF